MKGKPSTQPSSTETQIRQRENKLGMTLLLSHLAETLPGSSQVISTTSRETKKNPEELLDQKALSSTSELSSPLVTFLTCLTQETSSPGEELEETM